MTKQNIRAVRKQAGASSWAIRLGRLLESIIVDTADREVSSAGMDVDGGRRSGKSKRSYSSSESSSASSDFTDSSSDGGGHTARKSSSTSHVAGLSEGLRKYSARPWSAGFRMDKRGATLQKSELRGPGGLRSTAQNPLPFLWPLPLVLEGGGIQLPRAVREKALTRKWAERLLLRFPDPPPLPSFRGLCRASGRRSVNALRVWGWQRCRGTCCT